MIFDIQDMGAGLFTYIWTMYEAVITAGQLYADTGLLWVLHSPGRAGFGCSSTGRAGGGASAGARRRERVGGGDHGAWRDELADFPAGATAVRWTHAQDASLSGRGIYLDGITIRDGRRVLVDTERQPDPVQPDGWTPAPR